MDSLLGSQAGIVSHLSRSHWGRHLIDPPVPWLSAELKPGEVALSPTRPPDLYYWLHPRHAWSIPAFLEGFADCDLVVPFHIDGMEALIPGQSTLLLIHSYGIPADPHNPARNKVLSIQQWYSYAAHIHRGTHRIVTTEMDEALIYTPHAIVRVPKPPEPPPPLYHPAVFLQLPLLTVSTGQTQEAHAHG